MKLEDGFWFAFQAYILIAAVEAGLAIGAWFSFHRDYETQIRFANTILLALSGAGFCLIVFIRIRQSRNPKLSRLETEP